MDDTNSYRSIDFLLNILYDKLYNTDSNKCYTIPPISKKDITIYQLKRKYSDEIDILFDGDISFEGKSNNKWLFKCKSKTTYPCLIVVSEYNTETINYDDLSINKLIFNI